MSKKQNKGKFNDLDIEDLKYTFENTPMGLEEVVFQLASVLLDRIEELEDEVKSWQKKNK